MVHTSSIRRALAVTAVATAACFAAQPAFAQHRARLSADLSDALRTGSNGVDVIVHGSRSFIDATAVAHGLRVKRYMKSGAVFHLTAGQLFDLQQDETLDHLSADVRIQGSDVTTDTIDAADVWAGTGQISKSLGSGVGVALIDSGVDFNHASLKGRIAATVDFTGGNGADQYGHGTHVASTIAGAQGTYATTLDYSGVAPGAKIINLRVLGADGSGYASDVIEAVDWAIDNKARYNIRVINLSLGAPVTQPYRDDPLCEAVERAVQAGIVVVAAAGNHGKTVDGTRTVYGAITTPGNDPNVLTVGAIDTHATVDRSDDTVAPYSSRGPTMYDLVMKPDLVAPGSHIVGAEAPGSYFATAHPERYVAGSGEGAYIQLSGTSMATAVASGAVALLLGERPNLSPNDVKVTLQMTATLMPSEGLLASGAGSMNAYAAAEFARGFVGAAMAASLTPKTGGTGGLQLVSAQTSGKPTVVAFGTIGFWGSSILWGKSVYQSKVYAWAHRTATRRGLGIQLISNAPGRVRGSDDSDSIVWGNAADEDSIVWGNSADEDSIVWGNSADEDSIVWGNSADEDSIVWGNSADEDSIVWGNSADEDSIVWGNSADEDSIVWGNSADEDSIVWGNSADEDSIVWGNSADEDSIVWGNSADEDSIVWGN